jgi:beta-glucanase (GH16 family)
MKLSYVLTVPFLLFSFLLFPQQTPIDFSSGLHNFSAFANSSFAFTVNPQDPNDDVGQFHNDGSENWQGFYIDLTESIDLSQEQVITLSFYQFDPNVHNIMVKLEFGTGPDVEVVQSNSGSGWTNDMTFDFSNAILSGDGASVNAMGTYSRLVIFVDGGSMTPGTYLIDDINDGSQATDPHELDVIYNDLVWADEFDSSTPEAIDVSKWYHQTSGPNGGQWYNGEEQHYTNRIDNSFVENGFLNIVAKAENFTQDNVTLNYTSARLNSKFAFTYGRIDVRAKLPEGDGTWPAIWTLGKNVNEVGAYWQTQGFGTTGWPACGEIDVMEHGLGATNHVSSALHTPSSHGATENFQSYILNNVANNFHVYSMNWSPNQITFLIDGVGFYTYNPEVKDASTWPFDADQYLLLNVAMGGVSGAIDPNFTQSDMVIDYVRVYQNNPLSIDDVFANTIGVYPNPAKDIINIISEYNFDSVELYNTIGQLVLNKNQNARQLNVENLNSGVYVLKLNSKGKTATKRVIID